MKCPACGDLGTRVVDSRSAKEDTEIRRRRLCDTCTHRFTTFERAEQAFLRVVKKDFRREHLDRDKILRGVAKACEKRPISTAAIEKLSNSIINEITGTGEMEISSKFIGEMIMKHLKELDEVAYVRFASVYRSFKDIGEFMDEVVVLVKDRKKNQEENPQ